MARTVSDEGTKALAAAGIELNESAVGADIQQVSETADLAKLASNEAFMNEPVIIRVMQTINPNDPPRFKLTCNSPAESILVERGIPIRVQRKHVEILARMKEVRYVQKPPTSTDLETGNALYASVGQVYPFEVVKDDNPRGRAWLENILAEPV